MPERQLRNRTHKKKHVFWLLFFLNKRAAWVWLSDEAPMVYQRPGAQGWAWKTQWLGTHLYPTACLVVNVSLSLNTSQLNDTRNESECETEEAHNGCKMWRLQCLEVNESACVCVNEPLRWDVKQGPKWNDDWSMSRGNVKRKYAAFWYTIKFFG